MNDRLVVYTNVLGWKYDLPQIQPSDNVDYICFTDQEITPPAGWKIRNIDPLLPNDIARSSRVQKTRPHCYLLDYSRSLYIDSTVLLKQDPETLWHHLIPNDSILFGGVLHSFRDNIEDEFEAVRCARLDHNEKLDEQIAAYQRFYPELLASKPVWGGMLARRHNDSACIDAMELWFANILRYSRRDQLSLPLALSQLADSQKNLVSLDLYESAFHKWPVTTVSRPSGYQIEEIVDIEEPIESGQSQLKNCLGALVSMVSISVARRS